MGMWMSGTLVFPPELHRHQGPRCPWEGAGRGRAGWAQRHLSLHRVAHSLALLCVQNTFRSYSLNGPMVKIKV